MFRDRSDSQQPIHTSFYVVFSGEMENCVRENVSQFIQENLGHTGKGLSYNSKDDFCNVKCSTKASPSNCELVGNQTLLVGRVLIITEWSKLLREEEEVLKFIKVQIIEEARDLVGVMLMRIWMIPMKS